MPRNDGGGARHMPLSVFLRIKLKTKKKKHVVLRKTEVIVSLKFARRVDSSSIDTMHLRSRLDRMAVGISRSSRRVERLVKCIAHSEGFARALPFKNHNNSQPHTHTPTHILSSFPTTHGSHDPLRSHADGQRQQNTSDRANERRNELTRRQ